jgi:hypothetical protein
LKHNGLFIGFGIIIFARDYELLPTGFFHVKGAMIFEAEVTTLLMDRGVLETLKRMPYLALEEGWLNKDHIKGYRELLGGI